MTETVADTAATRLAGERPSRARALATAAIVGLGAAVVTYKVLRAEPGR
jgi:hypothetical protein